MKYVEEIKNLQEKYDIKKKTQKDSENLFHKRIEHL